MYVCMLFRFASRRGIERYKAVYGAKFDCCVIVRGRMIRKTAAAMGLRIA